MELRRVSVVIPTRNEEKYIEKCINSVLSQDYPKQMLEVIFVDGASEDDTAKILKRYVKSHSFINLVENPKKFVQHALNIGVRAATGEYIVRMDAHSEYSDDYVSKCVEYLDKKDASDVGGPMVAKGKSAIQKVIAAAYHSGFALGGGRNHKKEYEGYTDTVYLGAFRRQELLDIGIYDERLVRNEDDDLSLRLIENGMKIYVTPEIRSVYYPRSSYKALFKQYFEYGMWKVAVIKKHKKFARLSHLVPMLFVAFLVVFGVLGLFFRPISKIFFFVISLYLILNFYFSFSTPELTDPVDKLRLVWVHFVLHLAYGIGFWAGIFKFFRTKW